MTGEVEPGATTKFVLGSREHLKLALAVEAAMPAVRKHLVLEVLEALKTRLMKGRKAEWEVVHGGRDNDPMKRYAWFALRKTSWNNGSARPVGIMIATDKPDWGDVYLGVSCYQQDLKVELSELRTAAAEYLRDGIGWTPKQGWPGWKYLEAPYRDWGSNEFLLRAADPEQRPELVEQLASEITGLAEAVEKTLDACARDR